MRLIMRDLSGFQEAPHTVEEELVSAINSPESSVVAAHLCEAAIEVEQANQTWPCGIEIADGEDGTSVRPQTSKDVVTILPVCCGYDQGSI